MPAFWVSLKRTWQCKSESSDVHDPKTRKPCGFGCSRSVSNLRDIIHGSKRHTEKQPSCSPRSFKSNEFLNPITHEVVLNESTCELKIEGFDYNNGVSSTSVDTLHSPRKSESLARKIHGDCSNAKSSKHRFSVDARLSEISRFTCKKCFDKFKTIEDFEAHHLSNHAVTELKEGDSSRRIVEIICRASLQKSQETNNVHIKRVLKVHNMEKTIAQFEEQRELVKIKASKLTTRHPRCLADGNELLRFHGTAIACSLGINGCSSLCRLKECGVCQILRNGFCEEEKNGVFTASTSGRALECVEIDCGRKGLVVCRVIAGRVHKPMENFQELAANSGFDSVAGKVGQYSNIEELFLLNPKALLPCFVVIY